jgi:hypothetical protein
MYYNNINVNDSLNFLKVFNKSKDYNLYCNLPLKDIIYIGRPSKFGNPFVIGKDGDRLEVVKKFYKYICDNPTLMSSLTEIKGKNLLCFCSPSLCHGHILLALANPELNINIEKLWELENKTKNKLEKKTKNNKPLNQLNLF